MSREFKADPASNQGIHYSSDQIRDCRTILVFNFFKGLLNRGIPLYADNLCIAFEREGIVCRQLRCPRVFRVLPRALLNLAFVFTEQAIVPIAGLWFDRVIYPYNSVALVGAFSRKTAVVVHDFISSRGSNNSFAARYLKLTQAIAARAGTDVIYVSRSTMRIGRFLRKFPKSRTFLFPNAFYVFQDFIPTETAKRCDEVLLCSGIGKNKDLSGALQLYLDSGLWTKSHLRILGLAGHIEIVDEFCRNNPQIKDMITVMPQVDDRIVVQAYEMAAWVWVHSMTEGYGRSIAEARLCGSRVIASNIAPFREQTDEATFLYRGLEEFKQAICRCEAAGIATPRRVSPEHELLHTEMLKVMRFDE
jgi:hypothetical protein